MQHTHAGGNTWAKRKQHRRTCSSLHMHEWINCLCYLCVLLSVYFADLWRVWPVLCATGIYYHDTAASSAGLESNILHDFTILTRQRRAGPREMALQVRQQLRTVHFLGRGGGASVGTYFLSAHVLKSAATGGDVTPRWVQRAAAAGCIAITAKRGCDFSRFMCVQWAST